MPNRPSAPFAPRRPAFKLASARGLMLLLGLLLLNACASRTLVPAAQAQTEIITPIDALAGFRINTALTSDPIPDAGLAALTTWLSPEGETRVIASASRLGQLLMYEGQSGALLQTIGTPGSLAHPLGLAVYGDLLLVVERDAGHVSLFALPGFEPLGRFGEGWLLLPHDLWLHESAPGELDVYITDHYPQPPDDSPLQRHAQRIKHFRLRLDESPPVAWLVNTFGAGGDAPNAPVLALAGDVAFDRLLLAPEQDDTLHHGLALHALDGHYRARIAPDVFPQPPDNLALYECPGDHGYWLASTLEDGQTRFHVLDRISLGPRGRFGSLDLAPSGGIALHPTPSERFPWGVLYFIDAGTGIAAFDWRDIAHTLDLWLDCPD